VKILRIADIPNNRTGGMSRVIYCGGDALAAMGHQVDYALGDQMHVGCLASLRRFAIPLHVPKLVRRLQKERGKYDVVEVHEPIAAPYCWQRRRAADLPPVVILSHGSEARGRQKQIEYKRQKGMPISFRERNIPLVAWQAMYAMRHADQVLCLNSLDQEFLISAGVAPDAITLLSNGVDAEMLHYPYDRAQMDVTDFLFLGTWIMRKGIIEVAAAMTRVMDQRPKVTFTVAGFGVPDEAVRASFPSRLLPRLTLVQKIEGAQAIAGLYRKHQVFVLPSYFEGQPLVMLEAAALGLAIVATDESGMHDFLESGRDGILVPVGDSDALATQLLRLCDDPATTYRLGSAARQKVQSYTWANNAKTLLRAYEKAIDRSRTGK
jgi:glycosyltransferase involved in cell wall biosynthesis